MRRSLLATLLLLTSPLVSTTALAQSPALIQQGPGLAPTPAQPQDLAPAPVAQVVRPVDDRVAFNSPEQWLIPRYFQNVRSEQRRAARNKRYDRALPAGLTREPAKGDHLPLAVLAELSRLPGPLLRELPPARPGTDRVIVGKNVLMVATADGEVLDILPGIIF